MADVAMDVPAISRGQRKSTRNRGLPYARPAPRAAASTPAANNGSTRLYVSNLHYEVTEADLNKLFSSAGMLATPPTIVYDRSGRSTGIAHIVYQTHDAALRAKMRFDGQPAKGQNISIRFEAGPTVPSAAAGAQGKSLLARIGANPTVSLLDRLGAATGTATKPALTAAKPAAARTAPARAPRGKRLARASRAKPKTQTDLDKELDAYLGTDGKPQNGDSTMKAADVEMAA